MPSVSCQGVDLFTKDFVFVPIHDALHWSLAIVCHPSALPEAYDARAAGDAARVQEGGRRRSGAQAKAQQQTADAAAAAVAAPADAAADGGAAAAAAAGTVTAEAGSEMPGVEGAGGSGGEPAAEAAAAAAAATDAEGHSGEAAAAAAGAAADVQAGGSGGSGDDGDAMRLLEAAACDRPADAPEDEAGAPSTSGRTGKTPIILHLDSLNGKLLIAVGVCMLSEDNRVV